MEWVNPGRLSEKPEPPKGSGLLKVWDSGATSSSTRRKHEDFRMMKF